MLISHFCWKFLKIYSINQSSWSRSVVSDSLWPYGLQPTRLLHPWNFLGKSTGVGCHFTFFYNRKCTANAYKERYLQVGVREEEIERNRKNTGQPISDLVTQWFLISSQPPVLPCKGLSLSFKASVKIKWEHVLVTKQILTEKNCCGINLFFFKYSYLFGCIRSLLYHVESFVVVHGLSSCGIWS